MEQERLRQFELPESEPEEQEEEEEEQDEVEDFSDIEEPEDSDGDGEHIPSDDDEDYDEPPEHAPGDQPLFKPLPKPVSSKLKSKSKSKSSVATPKRKRKPPSESKANDATATRRRPASSIELTTYRLEKITGQDNPPVRSGFNPYDIIRQLFCELAAGFTKKVDGRVERAAIEGFERELDGRFVELIDLFEAQLAATVRARKENQRKLALQRELMEIRRQRQLVIAQTDDVRTNHKMAVVENKVWGFVISQLYWWF
ncbi:hypothetical protein EX30DRAFT_5544 [Ascodesmis nigricans]|uniref:Inner kinetochore subunit AME1 domain-containing protein n=1 Tax=Ascodesmis nigricans TaxID=341454 RepID=A0A4S2N655_9PEZI|nr:hypothetical protein EX30DRAFT_5544 [Ascodesmis nigricans]